MTTAAANHNFGNFAVIVSTRALRTELVIKFSIKI